MVQHPQDQDHPSRPCLHKGHHHSHRISVECHLLKMPITDSIDSVNLFINLIVLGSANSSAEIGLTVDRTHTCPESEST